MILKDRLSQGMVVTSIVISLHLYGVMGDKILMPLLIAITGIILRQYIVGSQPTVDDDLTSASGKKTLFLVSSGVLALGFSGVIGRNLSIIEELSIVNASLCVSLIAIGEEMLFRGAIFPYLQNLTKSIFFSMVGSSAIFMAYHQWVYGTDMALMGHVWFAGILLAFVAFATKRLYPSMFIHLINNILAVRLR